MDIYIPAGYLVDISGDGIIGNPDTSVQYPLAQYEIVCRRVCLLYIWLAFLDVCSFDLSCCPGTTNAQVVRCDDSPEAHAALCITID